MTSAIAEAKAPVKPKAAGDELPRPLYIEFAQLGAMGLGFAPALEERAERIAMQIDRTGGRARIRTEHLKALLPPDLTERALTYKPAWGELTPRDIESLGFAEFVNIRDVRALLERRGVMVRPDGQVDRRALEPLCSILGIERGYLRNDMDLVACNTIWQSLSESMFTTRGWVAPDPPLPPEPVQMPWDDPIRQDTRMFIHRGEKYDPDEEPMNRCICLGVRVGDHPNGAWGRGRKYANAFDLYRRLGLFFVRPGNVLYRVDAYLKMMEMAYKKVFGTQQSEGQNGTAKQA